MACFARRFSAGVERTPQPIFFRGFSPLPGGGLKPAGKKGWRGNRDPALKRYPLPISIGSPDYCEKSVLRLQDLGRANLVFGKIFNPIRLMGNA